MPFEVGQRDYAETTRDILAHADGIGIVEPERLAHSHAPLGQRRSQRGLTADSLVRENFARYRAGVLGIDVQLIGLEGVEEHLRPAQSASMR